VTINARTKKRLNALRKADEALYELWKQSEVNSEEMAAINRLQIAFVQPAIIEIERSSRRGQKGKRK
jgi:hypothetical protein